MDKTLEIVMVAVALIIAVVVVTSMLQGQSSNFGDFADKQSSSSSCDLAATRISTTVDCDSGSSSDISTGTGTIYDKYKNQCWSSASEAWNRAC